MNSIYCDVLPEALFKTSKCKGILIVLQYYNRKNE